MTPLREAERAGMDDVAIWRRDPATLQTLRLGAFEDGPVLQVVARRALLALRVPPQLLTLFARRAATHNVLELTAYWCGVRRALRDRDLWRRLTQGTTIVMYHAIGQEGEQPGRLVLPRSSFERQMRSLARRRPVLALDDLVEDRRSNRLPPAKAVAITFDDGYLDNLTLAAPILARLGLPATIFLVTSRIGAANGWDGDGELAQRPLVSWPDVEELRGRGFTLGAHTRSHPRLTEVSPEQLDGEIAGSRADLAERLGSAPCGFAYPYGKWNDAAAEAARRAGFTSACTIRAGRNDAATPLHALRRTEIHGTDSRLRFALGLAFGDTAILDGIVRRVRKSHA